MTERGTTFPNGVASGDGFRGDHHLHGDHRRSAFTVAVDVGLGVASLLAIEGGVRVATGHWQPGQLDQWLAQFSPSNHHVDTTTGQTGTGKGHETPGATATPEISQDQIQAEIKAFNAATGHTYTDRIDPQTGAVTFVDVTAGNVDVAVVNSSVTLQTLDKQGKVTSSTTTPKLQFIGPKQGDTQPSAGQQLQEKLYSTQELGDKTQHTARNPFDLPPGAKLTIQVQPGYNSVFYIITMPSGETLTLTNSSATHNLVQTDSSYINQTNVKYNHTLTLLDPNHRTTVQVNLPGSFSQAENGTYVAPGQTVGSGIPNTVDGQSPTAVVFSNDGVPILPFSVGGIVVGGVTA